MCGAGFQAVLTEEHRDIGEGGLIAEIASVEAQRVPGAAVQTLEQAALPLGQGLLFRADEGLYRSAADRERPPGVQGSPPLTVMSPRPLAFTPAWMPSFSD